MASYMVLFNFTQQGIENIKELPDRVEKARQAFRQQGATVKAFYAVMGAEFDTVFLAEAPDDESIARAALSVSALGNVRTRTVRAFDETEVGRIVSRLP
jgi:uncharacterized protein with GYD domain